MTGRRTLRERLDAGDALRGLSCALGDLQIAEEFAMAGFDYVYLDQQHGHVTPDRLLPMTRTIAMSDTSVLVRVAENSGAAIGAALDAGAEGVIVPTVESAVDAERAVRACKYAPVGERSWGPMRAVHGLGIDPAAVNERTVCLVMIETRAGLEALDSILDVAGIDGIYLGPADLAVSFGGPPKNLAQQTDPDVLGAIASIRDACVARGKTVAVTGTPATLHQQGYQMVTAASDYTIIRSALERLRNE